MAKKKERNCRLVKEKHGGKNAKGASAARAMDLRKTQNSGKNTKKWRAHQGSRAAKFGKMAQTRSDHAPSSERLKESLSEDEETHGMEDLGDSNSPKAIPHGYQKEQRILLVGEGDFSFSLALAQLLGSGANIFATAYDSEDTVVQKYNGAQRLVEELRSTGAKVLFNVDATRLQQCLHVGKNRRKAGERSILEEPFDRVVFNFPHVGMGIKDQAANVSKNRTLLAAFFASAAPLLHAERGEIHVAVKTGGPYLLWNVPSLAAQTAALRLKTALNFRPSDFPGYAHRRTLGFKEGLSAKDNEEILGKARTYVFTPAP